MTQALGLLGLAAFGWLVLFQLALAFGAPLGRMAWGGTNRVLPNPLRWASLAAALIAGLGAGLVAQAAAFIPSVLPAALLRGGMWVCAGLFALSVLGNALSKSRLERQHGLPLAVVLSVTAAALALGL